MRHPDKPWNAEMPQKYIEGKRQQRVQSDAIETESGGKCPHCGRNARVAAVWITRRYGENGKTYDRWLAQQEITCGNCGQFRLMATDEEIDRTYERKGD